MPVSLVTIGIPAYQRPAELARAVKSALAQDHHELEVLISDDASPDPCVGEVASRLASADPRVRLVRQATNLGHAGNYQWLLESACGEYFMWLADDDWIDPQYVTRCLDGLRQDRAAVLVCGQGLYYRDGAPALEERPINLLDRSPARRLIRYFGQVSLNGPLFGLARREDLLAVGFPQRVGGDWLLVASLAAGGRVRTLAEVHVHRSLTGLGGDAPRLAGSFGMRGLAARQHHVVVAGRMFRDIASGAGSFGAMSAVTRFGVASAVALLILTRFTLAELVRRAIGPTAAATLEERISTWLRARET